MASPPSKKQKHTAPAAVASLSVAYSLLSQDLEHFTKSPLLTSSTNPSSIPRLLAQSESLLILLKEFTTAKESAFEEEIGSDGWRDHLDAKGTEIWNRSTRIKGFDMEEAGGGTWRRVVAKLRLVAFQCISLGSPEPFTLDTHAYLLSLSTQAASAFVAISDFSTVSHLLSQSASHASHFPPSPVISPSDSTPRPTKTLVTYYCTRARSSVQEGNLGVAQWVMEKAFKLGMESKLGGRELESVAELAREVGCGLLKSEEGESEEEKGKKAGSAIEWLLWGVKLVENRKGEVARLLLLAILKSLAQAHLILSPPGSGWIKAESLLQELIVLDSRNSNIHRRVIKLLIAREAPDGDVLQAFVKAAECLDLNEDECIRLLGELHRLPDTRRPLRIMILSSLLDKALGQTNSPNLSTSSDTISSSKPDAAIFLTQILLALVLLIGSKDFQKIEELFKIVTTAAPNFVLAASPAFVCTTYIWRQGDKAHKEGKFQEAADWYLLGSYDMFKELELKTWGKGFRKAALCLIEIKKFEAAEAVMRRTHDREPAKVAKSQFVRFYNFTLMQDEVKASAALHALLHSPDFTISMLLWAAKTAHASGMRSLLQAVLSALLDVCRGKTAVALNVDTMVLVRCLIRLNVTALDEMSEDNSADAANAIVVQFGTALELAQSISQEETADLESIVKNLSWLHRTGYNLCSRFTSKWDQSTLVELYDVVASIIELESSLSSKKDSETISRLWLCRFAALSVRFFDARQSQSATEMEDAYRTLLPVVAELRKAWNEAQTSFPNIDKGEALETALLGMEIEALSSIGDWSSISRLVDDFDQPGAHFSLSTVKLVAEKAVAADDCPADILFSILRRTLNLLASRKSLSTDGLARWLRMTIHFLLNAGAIDEALSYAENASALAKTPSSNYPDEELQWLVATLWDQGLDLFSAHSTRRARAWCSTAIQVAKYSDRALHERLDSLYLGICEKYPELEEGHDI